MVDIDALAPEDPAGPPGGCRLTPPGSPRRSQGPRQGHPKSWPRTSAGSQRCPWGDLRGH
eukprot:8725612-Pyramimonas_sp.AAC.1